MTVLSRYRAHIIMFWPGYFFGTLALLVTSITEVLVPKFVQWTIDLLTLGDAPRFFVAADKSASLNKIMLFF